VLDFTVDMNRRQFQDHVADCFRDIPAVTKVRASRNADFALHVAMAGMPDDAQLEIGLENAFRHFKSKGSKQSDLEETVMFLVRSLDEAVPGPVSPERLFPLVRHIGYLGNCAGTVYEAFNNGRELPSSYKGPLVRPFQGDLVFGLGHETAAAVAMIGASELEQIGMTVDDAWDRAAANLQQPRFKPVIETVNDHGLMAAHLQDEAWLTPTLLSNEQLYLDHMAGEGIDEILLSLPAWNEVFFVDAGNLHALDMMAHTIRQGLKQDHPQSGCVFRLKLGGEGLAFDRYIETD